MSGARVGRPYADPYAAGVALGLVLLAAYVVVGRGLGASGAFRAVADTALGTAPAGGLLSDWLVVEILGVLLGGFASAALAGRLRVAIERGPRVSNRGRLSLAVAGGTCMGVGAVLARGCTSGQALTGGALLSVGSWTFVAGAFGAAYVIAWAARRIWT